MNRFPALLCFSLSWMACGESPGQPALDASSADTPRADTAVDAAPDAAVDAAPDVSSDVAMDAHPAHDATPVDASGPVDAARTDGPSTPRTTREANGCAPGSAGVVDLTMMDSPVIVSGPKFTFTPGCARVRVGQRVTFRLAADLDWTTHTLSAGEIRDNMEIPDPTSPIPLLESGSAPVVVTFTQPGTYPYYCTRHWLTGHLGAIHVVP